MKIGELARSVGVRTSAIRFYEAEGLLRRAPRVSGRRVYADADVARLRMIRAALDAGFTIAEVKRLAPLFEGKHGAGARWASAAEAKIDELDRTIASLTAMRDGLRAALACACGGDADRCALVQLRPHGKKSA